MNPIKKCSTCHNEKELSEFSNDKYSKDGLRSQCKQCNNKRSLKYYHAHREERREYSKNYKALPTVKERERIQARKRLKKNSDKINKRRRLRAKNNRKRRSEQSRIYLKNNREKINKRRAENRKKNHEKVRKVANEWNKKNPEKLAAYRNKRYTAYEWADGEFSAEDIRRLIAAQGGKCLMCGKKKKLTVDHIVPISKGGRNDITNLQMLCGSCNSKKNATTIDLRSKKLLARIFVQGDLFG